MAGGAAGSSPRVGLPRSSSIKALNHIRMLPPQLLLDDLGVGSVSSSRQPEAEPCAGCRTRMRMARHPHDPQHLVVNGGGGAFLHPTHVFAACRFPAPRDASAEATSRLYADAVQPCTCRVYPTVGGLAQLQGHAGPSAATATSTSAAAKQQLGVAAGAVWPFLGAVEPLPPSTAAAAGPAALPAKPAKVAAAPTPAVPAAARCAGSGSKGRYSRYGFSPISPEGEYVCSASYPAPHTSQALGRRNLHLFRLRNSRWGGGGL